MFGNSNNNNYARTKPMDILKKRCSKCGTENPEGEVKVTKNGPNQGRPYRACINCHQFLNFVESNNNNYQQQQPSAVDQQQQQLGIDRGTARRSR